MTCNHKLIDFRPDGECKRGGAPDVAQSINGKRGDGGPPTGIHADTLYGRSISSCCALRRAAFALTVLAFAYSLRWQSLAQEGRSDVVANGIAVVA